MGLGPLTPRRTSHPTKCTLQVLQLDTMPLRYFESVDTLRRWGLTFDDNDKLHRCRIALRLAALKIPEGCRYGLALLVDASNTMEIDDLSAFAINAYNQDDPTKVVAAFITDFPELVDTENRVVHRQHVGQLLVSEKAAWGRHLHLGHQNMPKLLISGRFESPRLIYSTAAELMHHMNSGTDKSSDWFLKDLVPCNGWF
ncbi:hypothetical protein H257_16513 [Aphanomyces astaci]|uniref:Uncharacterized protein n=1 Tax=Aphanomyces astaci TaxID=112090 RepID=W4FKN1_APHAT|nr:hypothetical protein H257_16513 [Aphanomyces astaci]ETV67278.1 hypothetical protein H257_16513 [Aphanomyces astaci]|eukprot:XP_009843266.1 hypothetical protein H257_16513 [Aphanomyces astaci]